MLTCLVGYTNIKYLRLVDVSSIKCDDCQGFSYSWPKSQSSSRRSLTRNELRAILFSTLVNRIMVTDEFMRQLKGFLISGIDDIGSLDI